MSKKLRIDYYAIFREQRGLASEQRLTAARTARDLYAELQSEFGFTLDWQRVRVAVGDEFCSWDATLKDNDKVVFIPAVAGG